MGLIAVRLLLGECVVVVQEGVERQVVITAGIVSVDPIGIIHSSVGRLVKVVQLRKTTQKNKVQD